MHRIIFLIIFSFSVFYSFAQEEKPPVEVYLKQGKDSILINNRVISIKREPFTLIFVFNNPDKFPGVFMNTSLTKDYYRLGASDRIPDLNYLPQKVYSEHKFNPKKELKVNEEFFQYFGYNPNANWNKFDRLIKKDGKIIAYRKVKIFDVVNDGRKIPVDQMKYTLFLTFDVIRKRNSYAYDEIYRAKTKLKF